MKHIWKLQHVVSYWWPCGSPADETLKQPEETVVTVTYQDVSNSTSQNISLQETDDKTDISDVVSRSREKFVPVGQTFLTQAEVHEERNYLAH